MLRMKRLKGRASHAIGLLELAGFVAGRLLALSMWKRGAQTLLWSLSLSLSLSRALSLAELLRPRDRRRQKLSRRLRARYIEEALMRRQS